MSESERNDLDDAIDRAAQQMVRHEPSPRLYAAVMAGIETGSAAQRTPSPWRTWRWALAGLSAAACLAVIVLVWQQTQQPAAFPALPAAPHMARIAPAPTPPTPLTPSPSPARRPVERTNVAYLQHPQIAQAVVAGPPIDVKHIQIATIPLADIPVVDIPVSTIPVTDIADDAPISINTIGADAR
jgi:hypothetical protein